MPFSGEKTGGAFACMQQFMHVFAGIRVKYYPAATV